eukprot:1449843-Rhodomonas_salina.4
MGLAVPRAAEICIDNAVGRLGDRPYETHYGTGGLGHEEEKLGFETKGVHRHLEEQAMREGEKD